MTPMTWLEIAGDLTGLICVYLTVRNNIWNWAWGVANVLLFGALFIGGRLYSDAGLQLLYFLPMQYYGWRRWRGGGAKTDNALPVTVLHHKERIAWAAVIVAGSALVGTWMSHTDAAQPYLDASLSVMSVVAQFLDCRKKVESWVLWIAIDAVSAGYLYPKQHLYPTAALYVVFLVLAIQGWLRWRATLQAHPIVRPVAATK